jgi:hypothetical protein
VEMTKAPEVTGTRRAYSQRPRDSPMARSAERAEFYCRTPPAPSCRSQSAFDRVVPQRVEFL